MEDPWGFSACFRSCVFLSQPNFTGLLRRNPRATLEIVNRVPSTLSWRVSSKESLGCGYRGGGLRPPEQDTQSGHGRRRHTL